MDNIQFHRIPSQPLIQPKSKVEQATKPQTSFAEVLQNSQKNLQLKVSKHATERLTERNIDITDREWQVIAQKVNEAKQKGIKDSLVLLDQAALIVSAKNSTVITAMNRMEAKNQLFTNIDGTIVLS